MGLTKNQERLLDLLPDGSPARAIIEAIRDADEDQQLALEALVESWLTEAQARSSK